jgi:hypothetical protein
MHVKPFGRIRIIFLNDSRSASFGYGSEVRNEVRYPFNGRKPKTAFRYSPRNR